MREILGAHKLISKRQSMVNKSYQHNKYRDNRGNGHDDRFANNANSESKKSKGNGKSNNLKKPWESMECVYCHKIGHSAQRCPELTGEQKDGKSNRSAHNATKNNNDDVKNDNNKNNESKKNNGKERSSHHSNSRNKNEVFEYCAINNIDDTNDIHINKATCEHMEILDNGSNEHIFTDTKCIADIHKDVPIHIKGVDSKSKLSLDNVGEHVDWGESRINHNGNINLVSFSKARQDYYIEYDYDKNMFTLTNFVNGTKIHFLENKIGLYQRENSGIAAVSNTAKYTKHQIRQAEEARDLHNKMSHPGDYALGMLLDNGGIVNCKLTSSSLRLAKIIFGECEQCRHGKSTMPRKVEYSDRDRATNPGEILHMDIMFVPTGIKKRLFAYLISVDDYSNHALAYRLPSKNKSHIYSTIKKFIKFYWRYDWKVVKIMTDPESVFCSLIDDAADKLKVKMETSGVNEHEPVCERFIRVLRERIRINFESILIHKYTKYLQHYYNMQYQNLFQI
jgi:hypothetical protein